MNLSIPQKLPENVRAFFRVGTHELAHVGNVTCSHSAVRDDIVVLRRIQLESLRHSIIFTSPLLNFFEFDARLLVPSLVGERPNAVVVVHELPRCYVSRPTPVHSQKPADVHGRFNLAVLHDMQYIAFVYVHLYFFVVLRRNVLPPLLLRPRRRRRLVPPGLSP